ncbi:unnamed protein product [Alopecurus aequalis]
MRPRRRRGLPVFRGDADNFKRPVLNWPRYIISDLCEFASVIWMASTLYYYCIYDLPPEFSVHLTPIPSNISTEVPATSSIPRAFDAVLHASNRRATERCYHHGEAVVTYGGFTVASGRTPDFCVPWKGAREVPFRLSWDWDSGAGRLPEHLRGRIAAAERVGALELEVQVRFLQGHDARLGTGIGRPTWIWCKPRMAGAHGGVVTPCTVLALQNWFSHLA